MNTSFLSLQLKLSETERNIYQPAELFNQMRYSPDEYIGELISPYGDKGLSIENGKIICNESKKTIPQSEHVINMKSSATENDQEWMKLNEQFLNYHKSLTAYTLINSMPGINYIAEYSGLADLKNVKVVDVGGGTGHCLCTMFNSPETIDYYLLDPNLRKLHDQFIRLFPKLSKLKMKHLLAHAEFLPLKNDLADVVLSMSAIDHYADYKKFISEAYRILKPGGFLVICSHLDRPKANRSQYTPLHKKLFSDTLFERLARYFYYRKYAVGTDDHTNHFEDTSEIIRSLKNAGFKIIIDHTYSDNFIIKVVK